MLCTSCLGLGLDFYFKFKLFLFLSLPIYLGTAFHSFWISFSVAGVSVRAQALSGAPLWAEHGISCQRQRLPTLEVKTQATQATQLDTAAALGVRTIIIHLNLLLPASFKVLERSSFFAGE